MRLAVERDDSAPQPRTYRGGCGCGAIVYEVELDPRTSGERTRSVWERAVPPSGFRLLTGDEHLSGVQFARESVYHFYCERCGVRSFSQHAPAQRGEFYSVDLKCLDGCPESTAARPI